MKFDVIPTEVFKKLREINAFTLIHPQTKSGFLYDSYQFIAKKISEKFNFDKELSPGL